MLLYKYVSLDTADLILKNSTLRFSKASSLNDPFELTSLHYGSEQSEQLIRFIAASQSYGILSLTRNPLNPLMWAHYGKGNKMESSRFISLDSGNDSHAGMVFGIDVDEAGLNIPGSNIIPAKYGNVIYTSTRPTHGFEHSENLMIYEGLIFKFEHNFLEALQRIFLYKSSHWSYEEEVRVVRNISRNSKDTHNVPRSSFKEIYIGIRNSFNIDYLISVKEKIKLHLPDCKIYVCGFEKTEWTFNKILIDDAIKQCPQ